ncbi:MAG TPA: DUF4118 domain-containing protein, partial [Micrococcaceae bacterium]|nr:DUF4118 domain-containing protein [Micrococcaceae bacterium]
NPGALEAQRTLVNELGGSYRTVVGDDPARALIEFCRSVDATQLVLGASRHRTLPRIGAGTGSKAVRGSSGIDVHLVPHPLGSRGPVPAPRNGLGRRRLIVGFVLALLLPPLVQLALGIDPALSLTTAALVQLTGAVLVALIGGLWPGLLAAVSGSLLLNFFMTEPVGTLAVKDPQTVVALLVFVSVAATVAVVVDLSARRSKEAARARAEAATLSELTEDAIASDDAVPSLIERARETFQMRNVALFRRGTGDGEGAGQGGTDGEVAHGDGDGGYGGSEAGPGDRGGDGGHGERRRRDASAWRVAASAGQGPPATPAEGDNIEEVDPDTVLVLSGRPLPAGDLRLVAAFGRQLNAIRARQQLAASRGDNLRLAEGNRMRTSLLRAVSHDLRTPLAGIKLAVSSLRQQEVVFSPEDEQELLATIENYSDRLEQLVGNLLDMSRITSDSVVPLLQPVRWHEVLPRALAGLPAGQVHTNLPPNMPPVDADPGMLERVIANITENAVKYAPDSDIVLLGVIGGSGGSMVDGCPASELRIIDHGKGVAGEQVASIFRPFQRLNDTASAAGIGLGLAVARGFTEAMGGTLTAEPTPGGGLTMVIRLPMSAGARP